MPGPSHREKPKRGRRAAAGAARATAHAPSNLNPDLIATIHERIIPQLMLAEAPRAPAVSTLEARTPPTDGEVQQLAAMVLLGDLAGAHAFVASLMEEGLSLQSALLLLLAPAARRLQAEWLAKDCSFSEVASALGLIHQLVSALAKAPGSTPTSTTP